MTDIAVRVQNLGKEYRVGGRRRKNVSLREALSEAVGRWFAPKPPTTDPGSFWALREVSFEIKRGEVVGIVGHNGAGKSTLLKILSRITEPSTGMAEIHGRIGSLLEVGTGFHPELTGRENILLNGAILGMRRVEIDRRFDEIVDFAGVERFIDTPVKRYSSGMYLRLAFAVAVHLESEILLVDEVLAVGDAQFQKRCLDRMKNVSQSGRTVLLVSHNMSAIRNICHRGLILEGGRLLEFGEVNSVTDKYLARMSHRGRGEPVETRYFKVDEVRILSTKAPVIRTFDPVHIHVRFTPKVDVGAPSAYVAVLSGEHQRLMGLDFRDFNTAPPLKAGTPVEMRFAVAELPLLAGNYMIEVYLRDGAAGKTVEHIPRTFPFEVVESAVYGGRQIDSWHGMVGLHVEASIVPTPAMTASADQVA
jgi:lipopolysaccharide transport system ATP-binding protein